MEKITRNELTQEELQVVEAAAQAAEKYMNTKGSRYVGAALITEDGTLFTGASVRRTNASSSTCAERMALDKAVYNQNFDYKILAIVGFHKNPEVKDIISPCGLCRQIISEAETYGAHSNPIEILIANADISEVVKTDSHELFPLPYEAKKTQ